MVLDVHQTTEGVHYPVEDREDAQDGPKKVQLEDCRHHRSFWNKLAAKRELKKTTTTRSQDVCNLETAVMRLRTAFGDDLEHKCAHREGGGEAIRGFNAMALALCASSTHQINRQEMTQTKATCAFTCR